MNPDIFQNIVTSIPQRFRSEKAEGVSMIFHFNIKGNNAFPFTIVIENGLCRLEKELVETPSCVVTASSENYVKLELGELNPQLALMTGKVKVSNIGEMLRFAKIFRKYEVATQSMVEKIIIQRKEKNGPLKGLKIIDFTRLLPGPLATMLMADMGADVIKVEDPESPDYIRSFPPFVENESAYYLSLNRSKRSLSINFTAQKGKEIIYQLVKNADVLFEQFRPGVMQSMGFGYETLKKINPRLIYVSVTGYGQDGPYAQQAGHDLNYIGYSGLLGVTGEESLPPVIPGGQVADVAGGAYLAMNAALTAIYTREKTGKGQQVDVAMLDCVMPITALYAAAYFATGTNPVRGGEALSGGIANYQVYECADGKYIALGALEPKFWEQFCELVQKPQWKNRILDTGEKMRDLKKEVADFMKSKTQQQWMDLSMNKDVCLTPVLAMSELENNPQIAHRKMIVKSESGKMKLMGVPLKFSETPAQPAWDAPALGEDTFQILQEIGFNEKAIQELKTQKIIS